MANQEHVEIASAGAEAIRSWRNENSQEDLDLSGADLRGAQLAGAPLQKSNLEAAILNAADLNGADLTAARLREARLVNADLCGALLSEADLSGARACCANLRSARLERAMLQGADFSNASFKGTELSNARTGGTIWNSRELSQALGLDEIDHRGPDLIDVETVLWSPGEWPAAFLRGCGLPEDFILQLPEFAVDSAVYARCMVCFAEDDAGFAAQLIRLMRRHGMRCWPASLDDCRRQRDETRLMVHRTDVVLVCASSSALDHPELEPLVEAALEREQRAADAGERRVLRAIVLDDAADGKWSASGVDAAEERLIMRLAETGDAGELKAELPQLASALTIPRVSDSVFVPPVASAKNASPRKVQQVQAKSISIKDLMKLPGRTEGLISGFRRLLRNDGGNSVWFDYEGKKRPTHHLRQLSAGNLVEWETAPVPSAFDRPIACFVWGGSFGAFHDDKTGGFALTLNGVDQLVFDLSKTACVEQNEQGTVLLLFEPKWTTAEDAAGFFYLGVSPDLTIPGKSCRVGIRTVGVDSERFVGVTPMPDTIERQAESSG